jgi:hypothetical protein
MKTGLTCTSNKNKITNLFILFLTYISVREKKIKVSELNGSQHSTNVILNCIYYNIITYLEKEKRVIRGQKGKKKKVKSSL